jgi:hypothetical protein
VLPVFVWWLWVIFVIMAALVTNIAIDFVIALVTFVTKFRNVPVDTFAVILLMLPMLIIVYYGYPGTQKCFALHTFF